MTLFGGQKYVHVMYDFVQNYIRHGLNEHERVLGPNRQSSTKNPYFSAEITPTLAITSVFAVQLGSFGFPICQSNDNRTHTTTITLAM